MITTRIVSGWVLVPGATPPGHPLSLEVVRASTGAVVGSGLCLPDGQFAIPVPDGSRDPLLVHVIGPDGHPVGRAEVPSEGEVALVVDEPIEPTVVELPTMLSPGVPGLLDEISRHVAAEALPGEALDVTVRALGRLTWLEGLLAPAARAVVGDVDAAEVLRSALSPWVGLHWASPVPESDVSADVDDLPIRSRDTVVSPDAVALLVSATLAAGRDLAEQVSLTEALGAALGGVDWLSAATRASASADLGVMRTMMGAPGGFPGAPGGGLGGLPGIPGGGIPGQDDWGIPQRIPIKVSPTVADLVARFRNPILVGPSDLQRCVVGALAEVARARNSSPRYRITGLQPANACPGGEMVITGTGFGRRGTVVFPGGVSVPGVSALEWTDTRIRVRVPDGAAPGELSLRILIASLRRCGQTFTAFREGTSTVSFEGGTAHLLAFQLNGSTTPLRVDPGQNVSIWCNVATHPAARTHVFVKMGTTTVADFGTVSGGGGRQHSFAVPASDSVVAYRVHLRISGPCGMVEHVREVTAAARPRMRFAFIEVTQGLQNSAHTVRLVAGRTTVVRAYLTSGLGQFSYTGVPGEVPGVTGTLVVQRGGVVVASISSLSPVTIHDSFVDADRANAQRALRFEVPGVLVSGDLTFRVVARAVGLPGFGPETPSGAGARDVSFERGRTLTVVRLRMSLSHPGHPAAAPTVAEWQTASLGSQHRYPLADAGLLVRVPTGGDQINSSLFLGSRDGWADALDDLDDFADRFDDFRSVFACVVPNSPGGTVNGIAHAAFDRVWPLENDRRCFLSRAGRPGTFAHEMAHTLSVRHAPCGSPENIDSRLPPSTEAGVVGHRASDGLLMASGWPELMSYCTPSNGIYDDRWPSVALWNILLGQLN